MPQYVVCLSVCPAVCDVQVPWYRDHIGWNTSNIISQPNSLRPLLGLTPTWAIWCNGYTPKLGWNRGGVTQVHIKTCNISETVQEGTKVTMVD